MKNVLTYFTAILILVLLISCGGGQKEDKPEITNETPTALQDNKIEIKSYSRSADLTEELYQELVDKNAALKKLEEDVEASRTAPNELIEKINNYESKSNSYYSSATYKATAITDSILKSKIIALITSSNKKNSTKVSKLNSLLKKMSQNSVIINDYHAVLKIVLTLPLIEKYQKENIPNEKVFKELINNQETLIGKVDSLTPNY